MTTHDTPSPTSSTFGPGGCDLSGQADLCTCGRPWGSVLPPPPCPVHSGAQYPSPGWAPAVPVPNPAPMPQYPPGVHDLVLRYPAPGTLAPPVALDIFAELRQAVADLYEKGDLSFVEARDNIKALYAAEEKS